MNPGQQPGSLGSTCFGEVPQRAAEGAPLQPLPHGVGVVQAGAVHAAVACFLLEAGALRHAGPHHPLLLLQLSCGTRERGGVCGRGWGGGGVKTEVSNGGASS